MIKRSDIFTVKVTDEMIDAGVKYAERSLHYTYNRMGLSSHYDRVRNIVKGIVMERAFRRLLDHHDVQYDLMGHTHWRKKDRYDVGIDGHRYDVKGSHVSSKTNANLLRQNPEWLLDCCALVPADQVKAGSLKEDDYYVFPFLAADLVRDINHVYGLFGPQLSKYLLHSFWDYEWIKNEPWKAKGRLVIVSEMEADMTIRVGGQDANKEMLVEEILLPVGEQMETTSEFFTVLFIQTFDAPRSELRVSCEGVSVQEVISPSDWGNIWIYEGMVYLAGYITKGSFKQKGTGIPRFYKGCKQYGETKTENHMLLANELESLRELLPSNCDLVVQ